MSDRPIPTDAEMIKLMRVYRKLTQEELAAPLNVSRGIVSKYETGDSPVPDHMLVAVAHELGMEYIPRNEKGRDDYEEALQIWYDSISDDDFEEAEKWREKLSVIKAFPHEKDFIIKFELHNCRLLLKLNKLDEAKKVLDVYEKKVDELNDDQKHYYYFNKGTYNLKTANASEASKFLNKSLKLTLTMFKKSFPLNFSIAYCQNGRGFIAQAIILLEESRKLKRKGQSKVSLFWLYNLLGSNYSSIGLVDKAEKNNDKSFKIAEELKKEDEEKSKLYIGSAYLGYGYMYRKAKKYNFAISNFEKAIDILPDDDASYLETIFQKTICHIEMKDLTPCPRLIEVGLKRSKHNKVYNQMFRGLEIMANPYEDTAKILEEEIIPYLLEKGCIHVVLDFSRFLSAYYKTRGVGFVSRSYKMSELAFSLSERFHEGFNENENCWDNSRFGYVID